MHDLFGPLRNSLPSTFSNNDSFVESALALGSEKSVILGESEEGRPIIGFKIGTGPVHISLMAGAHADEPVGPETLRALVHSLLGQEGAYSSLLESVTFFIVPHVNPDGEAKNAPWIEKWPNFESYLHEVVRELPGRDVEFSWPRRRVENRQVADWLRGGAPFAMHASLHGMGYSEGAMLLIDKNWSYRTDELQHGFVKAASDFGLTMHDHNRKGEKGFFYIARGFTTTPQGSAMRTYFKSHGDDETASLFGDSSMEFVRSLGGDPLNIVTELPLFVVKLNSEGGIENPANCHGDRPSRTEYYGDRTNRAEYYGDRTNRTALPHSYIEFRQRVPEIKLRLAQGKDATDLWTPFSMSALPIETACALQVRALELALGTVLGVSEHDG